MEEKKPETPKAIRYISNAPPPAARLTGSHYVEPPDTRPIISPSVPSNYYEPLRIRTELILIKSCDKFPDRRKIREYCSHVISELSKDLCRAVRDQKLSPNQVRSYMSNLLASILRKNDNNSIRAFKLQDEIEKSEGWVNLLTEVKRAPGVLTKPRRSSASRLKEAIRRAKKESPGATQEEIAEGTDRYLKNIAFRTVCPKSWLNKNNSLNGLLEAIQCTALNTRVKAYISKI